MRHRAPLLLAALTFIAGCDAPKPNRLEYRTPAGVIYIVTADGLSEVRLGDKALAHGGWRFRVGDKQWGFADGPDAEAITARSLAVVSPSEVRVTHSQGQVLARHTFIFSGEDVRIESWVENRHPTAAIQVAAFEGPRVSFGRPPRGILPNWHSTYTVAHGVPLMHPGGIRVGGSYGIGVGFGVGAAPHDAGVHPTALVWDWDWNKRAADTSRTPTLFVNAPIPARGARTFAVTFRFSPNTDWAHLLDPYRRHLHATLGDKTLYDRPSNLPLVAGVVCDDKRSPTNPHGFRFERRLDSIYGISSYFGRLSPDMRAIPAQGLIIWGQAGFNPRGAMYRPDFDILPPDVAPNVARFAGLLKEQRMRFGVAARPGQIVQPLDWTTDTVSWINPARPEELELLTRRFNNMIALGASLFYLDSAGNRFDDVAILRAVRTGIGKQPGIGRAVQTYVEHPSDVVVPFSGLLPVLNGNAADGSLGITFAGDFWLNPPDTPTIPEVMRYFYPDVAIVALVTAVQKTDTDARRRLVVEYCYKLRMTPMIPDDWLGPGSTTAGWMAPLTLQYLTPEGQWREKPG
jgi:hypothetical protein